jgi:hypothetical protein
MTLADKEIDRSIVEVSDGDVPQLFSVFDNFLLRRPVGQHLDLEAIDVAGPLARLFWCDQLERGVEGVLDEQDAVLLGTVLDGVEFGPTHDVRRLDECQEGPG